MISKKKIVIYAVIMVLLLSYFPCRKILFYENYKNIEINDETVKCITIVSFHKRRSYTTENTAEIEKIIEYLESLKIRKRNLYEKITGEDITYETKMGFTICLYSAQADIDSNLIAEIKIGTGNNIIINGKAYILNLQLYEAYRDITDIYLFLTGRSKIIPWD